MEAVSLLDEAAIGNLTGNIDSKALQKEASSLALEIRVSYYNGNKELANFHAADGSIPSKSDQAQNLRSYHISHDQHFPTRSAPQHDPRSAESFGM